MLKIRVTIILMIDCSVFIFFKQKTAYDMRISDWSSDVCSSDLGELLSIGSIESARLHHRITEHHRDAERLWCGVGPEGVARQMRHVEHRAHVDAAAEDRIGRRQRRDQLLDGGSRRLDILAEFVEKRVGALDRKSTRLHSSH